MSENDADTHAEVAQMLSSLRPTRNDWVAALVAAAVSLLTSPILAVWSLILGGAVAVASLVLVRWAPAARTAFFIGAGLAVGVLPYLAAAVVAGVFSDAGTASGGVG
jgi:uncharacterized oligopeptide transporter (OPT) family protein